MTSFRALFTLALVPVLLVAGAQLAPRPAHAVPVPFTGELPLSGDDIRALRQRLTSDQLAPTLDFLTMVRVFEDDASTPDRPIFYLAPFFTADTSQEVIGGQKIATDLLAYLDALDKLLAAIEGSHRTMDRLDAIRLDYLAIAKHLEDGVSQLPDDRLGDILYYAGKGNPYREQLEAVAKHVEAALGQLTLSQRRRVTAQVLAALEALRVPLTSAERYRAYSDPIGFMIMVLPRLRATLATMTFGIRHATFVSGLTAAELAFVGHYRAIRPDVELRPLPIHVLRALSLASSGDPADGGGFAGPELIRAINRAGDGACGVTSSCTVVIEYTEIGARSALLATRGASIMPVVFVGDVLVGPHILDTALTCDTSALRDRVALPFGAGLLADRQLGRALASPGICAGTGGRSTPLASATLMAAGYRELLFGPVQLSLARRRQRSADLDRLLDDSRLVASLGSFGAVLELIAGARGWLLDGLARTSHDQWLPRFPAELLAGIRIAQSGRSADTTRFDFDGIAIACWKRSDGGEPYLSACPDDAPDADLQTATATRLEARDCKTADDLAACITAIHEPPPDKRGFLWTGL